MRRFNIAYTIGCIALAALTLQSCNRSGNLDNLNVITKPYSVYFSDAKGLIYSTNDGQRFQIYPGSDGVPVQTLATSGQRILMVKENGTILFVSDGGDDNRPSFNPSYKQINVDAFGTSLLINLPGYNDTVKAGKQDRVYLATNDQFGMVYSDYNGNIDSPWYRVGDAALTTKVTSFAKQKNGAIVAYDDKTRKIYIKPDLGTPWRTAEGIGIPAPGNKTYIITQNNDILVVEIGTGQIYRSSNDGNNFYTLPALPTGVTDITCAAAPFGKVLIACTQNNGIWRLSGQGTWESASVGLETDAEVYAISFTSNLFKNKQAGEYVFVGTNKGLYRSDDLGQTWIRLDVTSENNTFTEVH